MTNWHALKREDVLLELQTSQQGLSREEAKRRLTVYGENRLPEAKTDTRAVIFLRQFQSPLIYLLLVAAAVMYATRAYTDTAVILLVLLFNALIGTFQEGKAQDTLKALRAFTETKATVLRGGEELIVSDCEVVPGDILILQEGAKVPGDARITLARSLRTDEASLTGESEPVEKHAEPLDMQNVPVTDRTNMVFKGTNITSGSGEAIVVATGLATEIGNIAQEIASIDTEVPLKKSIRTLSNIIIGVTLIGGTVLFAAGVALGNSAVTMFGVVVSLAVSVVPEGLPVVMTLVLASGVWRMGKQRVLVKKLQAVEALGAARIIAVDKTGTITRNELMVERVWTDGRLFSITGNGYEPTGTIVLDDMVVDAANHPELLLAGKIATLTASAQTMYVTEKKKWRVAGDPTEAALMVLGKKTGFTKTDFEREAPLLSEIPFDYRLKYHATLHQTSEKNLFSLAGAPEQVLELCTQQYRDGKLLPLNPAARKDIEAAIDNLSAQGLRVIAFAYRHTTLDSLEDRAPGHLVFGGLYGLKDALRPEVRESVMRAEQAGIRVVMITGDHALTAEAIAREVDIFKEGDRLCTGTDIDRMSDTELAHALVRASVFARVTPEHKLRIIRAYRALGDITAMTGDGVNDAPSLVAADLGVAMGITGTEVSKEAADLVLLDDNFGSIVSAIEEGRSIYKTIKKVILYLFSTGLGEALTIIIAILIGLPLPLLATQIIWLNFVTDGFLVVALGLESKEHGLLGESGRKGHAQLFDSLMLQRMLVMGSIMVAGTLFLFVQYLNGGMAKAMTISLTTLAVFQWFNAWNCRSATESVFRMNPFKNPYLIGATLAVILLQLLALSIPFLQDALHTTSLSGSEWFMCIGVASTVLFAEELRKLAYRLRHRSKGYELNAGFTRRTV